MPRVGSQLNAPLDSRYGLAWMSLIVLTSVSATGCGSEDLPRDAGREIEVQYTDAGDSPEDSGTGLSEDDAGSPSDAGRPDAGGSESIDAGDGLDAGLEGDAGECGGLGQFCEEITDCAAGLECAEPGTYGGVCLPPGWSTCGTDSPPCEVGLYCFNAPGESGLCVTPAEQACACNDPDSAVAFSCASG